MAPVPPVAVLVEQRFHAERVELTDHLGPPSLADQPSAGVVPMLQHVAALELEQRPIGERQTQQPCAVCARLDAVDVAGDRWVDFADLASITPPCVKQREVPVTQASPAADRELAVRYRARPIEHANRWRRAREHSDLGTPRRDPPLIMGAAQVGLSTATAGRSRPCTSRSGA